MNEELMNAVEEADLNIDVDTGNPFLDVAAKVGIVFGTAVVIGAGARIGVGIVDLIGKGFCAAGEALQTKAEEIKADVEAKKDAKEAEK